MSSKVITTFTLIFLFVLTGKVHNHYSCGSWTHFSASNMNGLADDKSYPAEWNATNYLYKNIYNPSKSDKSNHSEPKPVLKTDENTQTVVYKTIKGGNLELDIDFPPDAAKTPVILYAHSWSGNKNQLKAYSTRLAKEGVAGVRINYRKLSDGHSFEQAISDVRDAFQWIRDNAEKYHFDTERMGIAGASAGGLLSALVALENKDCRIYIGFNGGYDLVQRDGSKWPPDDRMETLLAGKNTKKNAGSGRQFTRSQAETYRPFCFSMEPKMKQLLSQLPGVFKRH